MNSTAVPDGLDCPSTTDAHVHRTGTPAVGDLVELSSRRPGRYKNGPVDMEWESEDDSLLGRMGRVTELHADGTFKLDIDPRSGWFAPTWIVTQVDDVESAFSAAGEAPEVQDRVRPSSTSDSTREDTVDPELRDGSRAAGVRSCLLAAVGVLVCVVIIAAVSNGDDAHGLEGTWRSGDGQSILVFSKGGVVMEADASEALIDIDGLREYAKGIEVTHSDGRTETINGALGTWECPREDTVEIMWSEGNPFRVRFEVADAVLTFSENHPDYGLIMRLRGPWTKVL